MNKSSKSIRYSAILGLATSLYQLILEIQFIKMQNPRFLKDRNLRLISSSGSPQLIYSFLTLILTLSVLFSKDLSQLFQMIL